MPILITSPLLEKKELKLVLIIFYVPTNEFNKQSNVSLEGAQLLNEIGESQEEFVENANNYTHYYDNHILKTNTIDDNDHLKIMEVLSNVNRLQCAIGKKFIVSFNKLKELEKT
jgi:hypothetical protein